MSFANYVTIEEFVIMEISKKTFVLRGVIYEWPLKPQIFCPTEPFFFWVDDYQVALGIPDLADSRT